MVRAEPESSDQVPYTLDDVSTDGEVHGGDSATITHNSDGLCWEACVLDRITTQIRYAGGIGRKRILLIDRGSWIGINSSS